MELESKMKAMAIPSPPPPAPLLDLPSDLTELILQRLPLSDYVRFGAVCRRCRSIQVSHRFRLSPHPPPMVPLPWLVLSHHQPSIKLFLRQNLELSHRHQEPHFQEAFTLCYSPFERRLYRLRNLPAPPLGDRCLASSNGWFLLQQHHLPPSADDEVLSLFNPFTCKEIHLPLLPRIDILSVAVSSPSAPPPNRDWAVMVVAYDLVIYLHRPGEFSWTRLLIPDTSPTPDPVIINSTVSCRGKFYTSVFGGMWSPVTGLVVVDPEAGPPTVQFLHMGPSPVDLNYLKKEVLVESNGEVLLMALPKASHFNVRPFCAFKADFERKVWVRTESLGGTGGDRLLLIDNYGSSSLVAADVGGERNCVYIAGMFEDDDTDSDGYGWDDWNPWKVFDGETGMLTGGKLLLPNTLAERYLSHYPLCWIVPSLDVVNQR